MSCGLCVLIAAALLCSGCAGDGRAFVPCDPEDLGPEVAGKTALNALLAVVYVGTFPFSLFLLSDDPTEYFAALLKIVAYAIQR